MDFPWSQYLLIWKNFFRCVRSYDFTRLKTLKDLKLLPIKKLYIKTLTYLTLTSSIWLHPCRAFFTRKDSTEYIFSRQTKKVAVSATDVAHSKLHTCWHWDHFRPCLCFLRLARSSRDFRHSMSFASQMLRPVCEHPSVSKLTPLCSLPVRPARLSFLVKPSTD